MTVYETHHEFNDVEVGTVLLWNGTEYVVEEKNALSITLQNESKLDRKTVNERFSSADDPFEIRL